MAYFTSSLSEEAHSSGDLPVISASDPDGSIPGHSQSWGTFQLSVPLFRVLCKVLKSEVFFLFLMNLQFVLPSSECAMHCDGISFLMTFLTLLLLFFPYSILSKVMGRTG